MQKIDSKLQYKILAVLFIMLITIFSFISDIKYIDYYVNDRIINEYWNSDLGRKNETDYSTMFFNKRWFIDINGGIRRALHQRSMNGVEKLNNGHLTPVVNQIDGVILSQEAENIQKLYLFCESQNIPFIYVAAPDKISPYNKELPLGLQDYSNENIDTFLAVLGDYNVPYIDMRKEFFDDGLNQYDYFSKTDHHWNSIGGYFCYTKLAEWFVDSNIFFDINMLNLDNYEISTYQGKLLGSWGQRTGKYFAGTDDLYVYYPEFDTSITSVWEGTTGTYEEILLNQSLLENSGPEFIYDGLFDNMKDVVNNNAENETSILMISDSFSRVVNPWIILSIKNFYMRSSYDSASVTGEYISEKKPDAVILLQSPWNNLGSANSYNYLPDVNL